MIAWLRIRVRCRWAHHRLRLRSYGFWTCDCGRDIWVD